MDTHDAGTTAHCVPRGARGHRTQWCIYTLHAQQGTYHLMTTVQGCRCPGVAAISDEENTARETSESESAKTVRGELCGRIVVQEPFDVGGNLLATEDTHDVHESAASAGPRGQLSGVNRGDDIVEDGDKGAGVGVDEPAYGPCSVKQNGGAKLEEGISGMCDDGYGSAPCCRAEGGDRGRRWRVGQCCTRSCRWAGAVPTLLRWRPR